MTTFRRITLVALAASTSACFATRNDVRILQGDLFAMRAETARADSQRARQIAAVMATLAVANDSLRQVSTRLGGLEGDTRQSFYSIDQQLLQIGELVGQGQNKLADLRAEMERRNLEIMRAQSMVAPPATTDSSGRPLPGGAQPPAAGGAAPAGAVPQEGPYQLYQLANEQLNQGAYSTARGIFQQLLAQYDSSDLAPDAQRFIALSYENEGRTLEADSTYQLVVQKYPRSKAAPTAMFKHATLLNKQGKRAEARAAMMDVKVKYPTSDEAQLVDSWLQANPS